LLFLDGLPTGASFVTTDTTIRNAAATATVSVFPLFLSRIDPTAKKGSMGSVFTEQLTSKSGLPVCKYALGGAARSTQPNGLVHDYCDNIRRHFKDGERIKMAPFLFYYNPHRYPDFMKGIREIVQGDSDNDANCDSGTNRWKRENLFLASGGTDRSESGMEQRLSDALAYSGEEYLDMFVLEYVSPDEVENDLESIKSALIKARSWVNEGRVRYVAASTHSHRVGARLGSLRSDSEGENKGGIQRDRSCPPLLDAMMLRYNMAHKTAAESISFPVCAELRIPCLAFTTTRWNRLQAGHPTMTNGSSGDDEDEAVHRQSRPPTTTECLSFALSPSFPFGKPSAPWPVEIVLHSARSTDELNEAMDCLSPSSIMTANEARKWRGYGDLEWNDLDGFDEFPEEQNEA
jgi:aryl-alcohol dehydrogenase-like predicted oxidoreductase